MIDECLGCGYTTEVEPYKSDLPGSGDHIHLCKICANTPIGNSVEYFEQYSNERSTLKTIGYIGNMLLDEIKKIKEG